MRRASRWACALLAFSTCACGARTQGDGAPADFTGVAPQDAGDGSAPNDASTRLVRDEAGTQSDPGTQVNQDAASAPATQDAPGEQAEPAGATPPSLPRCDPSPEFHAGSVEVATRASWLSVAEDSTRLLWVNVGAAPAVSSLRLTGGTWSADPSLLFFPADGRPAPGELDPDVPWRTLLGPHAASTTLVLSALTRVFGGLDLASLEADRGGLAVTPDGQRLVQSRCVDGVPSLWIWDTRDGRPLPPIELDAPAACATSMVLSNELAWLGDRGALRVIDLVSGLTTIEYSMPGVVGRIDASSPDAPMAVALVVGDLVDLEPGVFDALGLVLDATGQRLWELDLSGALLDSDEFAPGYLSVPIAVAPDGATAYFVPHEDGAATPPAAQRELEGAQLRLRTPDGSTLGLDLEASDPILEAQPTGLPVTLDFSSDGTRLFAIRDNELYVFDCSAE